MIDVIQRFGTARSLAVALLASAPFVAAAQNATPNDWLRDMAEVVADADYEGTVIRRQNGTSEALKIVHKIVDGVVNEKLISQEGNGLEIIRFGDEVHCILPDKKKVLIERWNNQSTLFNSLPNSDASFGAQYNVSIVREGRVAGRAAVLLAIRPHDEFRFGHRLWLDRETAFPLRTDLIDNDGLLIEQIKFADIRIGQPIPTSALSPSVNLDSFTWYAQPAKQTWVDNETDWAAGDLPAGFRLTSSTIEQLPGATATATHIVYSDGLATVSVFVTPKRDKAMARRSSVGSTSAYSIESGDFQITAIGAVPVETVQRIASSMRQQQGQSLD